MLVDLVETTTQDALTLHGAYHQPSRSALNTLPIDAVLLIHGVGSNFYSTPLLAHLAQQFAQRGLHALRINTRGHDFVSLSRTPAGPQRTGAAYETVDRCRYDLQAWSEVLMERGAQRIGLIGHSLGAVKALYATALHPHHATRLVIALSPPRLSFSAQNAGPRKKLFQRTVARAQAHMDEGKPETLMRVKYPFPLLITAAGYLEKYGPGEKYNVLRFANQLPCPVLFTFGQEEIDSGSVAFASLPAAIQDLPSGRHPLETLTVPDANHLYDGCWDCLTNGIFGWLGGLDQPTRD